MGYFRSDGTHLIREFDGEKLWIEPWGKNALRVRATYLNTMPDENWALLPSKDKSHADIAINESSASIQNGSIKAVIHQGGDIHFYDGGGSRLLREQWRSRANWKNGAVPYEKVSALEIPGRVFQPILEGDWRLTVRFEPNEGEKIFGMGQYQDGCLDKMGCRLELAQRNSQASVPFMLSNKGYGFLWNNPAVGYTTFARNVTEWYAQCTQVMDYWITAGDTPDEIVTQYAAVTGTVPMMPEFGLGFWQCKLRYRTQEELLNVAREHKRRGLPMDVIVCDYFHWPLQGDWRFDSKDFPDPKAMVRELNEMGIELMVSVWPYVDNRSENYKEMLEKGYLVRVDRGMRYSMDYCGNTIPYDVTQDAARKHVFNIIKKNYLDAGIKIFWLDEAEPECKAYDFDLYRLSSGPVTKTGNIFPALYARGFYDGLKSSGIEAPVNLLRCAWAGSQRYGALVWSGDISTTFLTLREQLAAGLSMAIAGIPWWTTDIGGFHGGNQDDPDYRELLIRWFQFGAFCPVFRLHGYREHGQPSSDPTKAQTGGPNEVWSYGEEAYNILSEHLYLRERMRPYIRQLMLSAHEKGTPIIRPLFFDFPNDSVAWQVEDQFMFGPDVLVAPVLELHMRERKVYLPGGSTWRDAYGGTVYEGGTWVTAEAPLEHLPVFLRDGADMKIAKE